MKHKWRSKSTAGYPAYFADTVKSDQAWFIMALIARETARVKGGVYTTFQKCGVGRILIF